MLKVKFIRCGNAVMVEILEQGDEIKRGEFSLSEDYYDIMSVNHPSLCDSILYLRGKNTSQDFAISAYAYDDEAAARAAIKGFTALIQTHNASCKKDTSIIEGEVTIAE